MIRFGRFIQKEKAEPEAYVSFYNIYPLFSTKTKDFSLVLFDERRKNFHLHTQTRIFPVFCAPESGKFACFEKIKENKDRIVIF